MMKPKPTDAELEVMQVLWQQGPLTVREVNDALNRRRRVGYTTTLKIMQIMADKGLLERDTSNRSHVYMPLFSPKEIRSEILEHVVRTVFGGSTSHLVLHALGNHTASPEEVEEIRSLLDQIERDQDGNV